MARGKYTVNEVEERTKVPASTLRQWERRYGFPKPERSDAGYRLYSDHDIDHIASMKQHIADGIPASRAAELVKHLEPAVTGPRPLKDMCAELVNALVALDETKADKILSEAHSIHTVDAIMLELMQACVVTIGQQWHDGKIGIATEHFASNYIHGRLRALLNNTPNMPNAPAVVVACAPLEQHELGALVLAVSLRRSGYRVYYVGANTPVDDLRNLVRDIQAIGVMISATTAESAQQLLNKRAAIVGMAPVVAFGGNAFNEQPNLAQALGGHYLAGTACAAVERFHDLVQQQGAMRA